MYRAIYSLLIVYDITPQGGRTHAIVNLDRNGNSRHENYGRPRYRPRVVYLRVGDEFLVYGQWKRVERIRMEFELVITDEQALGWPAGAVTMSALPLT